MSTFENWKKSDVKVVLRNIKTLIMKKPLLLLITFCSLTFQTVLAQIPNPGFEDLLSGGTPQHWGFIYLFTINVDSSGNPIQDSIVYDGPFYSASTDAHSGNYALELRNAYNFTTGQGYSGTAAADDDTAFLGFGTMTLLPINYSPEVFSFYYKYTAVNPADSALGHVTFYDWLGNEVGYADYIITGTSGSYQLAQAAIAYNSADPVIGYSMYFTTTYTETGYPNPTLGTRLLVDDIEFSGISSVVDLNTKHLGIHPNPSQDFIEINNPSDYIYTVEIFAVTGELSFAENVFPGKNKLNIEGLTPGIYLAKIASEQEVRVERLIIQ
jgi:hypothetical protein